MQPPMQALSRCQELGKPRGGRLTFKCKDRKAEMAQWLQQLWHRARGSRTCGLTLWLTYFWIWRWTWDIYTSYVHKNRRLTKHQAPLLLSVAGRWMCIYWDTFKRSCTKSDNQNSFACVSYLSAVAQEIELHKQMSDSEGDDDITSQKPQFPVYAQTGK